MHDPFVIVNDHGERYFIGVCNYNWNSHFLCLSHSLSSFYFHSPSPCIYLICLILYIYFTHTEYLDNFHDNTNYANVIISDDVGGEHWRSGGTIPFSTDLRGGRPVHSNEATVGKCCFVIRIKSTEWLKTNKKFSLFLRHIIMSQKRKDDQYIYLSSVLVTDDLKKVLSKFTM